ncbi:hypothetical protein NDK43_13880 [Neobacillus pocheonensis]|uniref:Group-specific protein n=1 Tax=Neobacillus pocheonensis TaxID=363869 RepID=A0ABT0WB04_9BACI|nr:hypothetical protein [Neobacillus pocheonensis]
MTIIERRMFIGMDHGNYKGTDLYKEQYDFLVDWLNNFERIETIRLAHNLKSIVEKHFFYISCDDMHTVMKEAGILGDRWSHNISKKALNQFTDSTPKRPWFQDEMEMLEYVANFERGE